MCVTSFQNHFVFGVFVFYYFFPDLEFGATVKTIVIVCGFAALAVGIALLFLFSKKNEKIEKRSEDGHIGGFFVWASLGLALCLIMWISRFFLLLF